MTTTPTLVTQASLGLGKQHILTNGYALILETPVYGYDEIREGKPRSTR